MSRDGAPRAAATLCGLYHEAGQQLRRLQDQLAARDALIARLRARLAALEGHAAPSLVDALLEQVARFREQLRRREGGAREAGLRQEIERLTERLEEREQEVQRLLSQPQHAGARDAVLLRTSLEKKERAQATSRVLCHSLAAETHQLRRTLAATTHMCQHLAARLDEQQPSQGEPECAGEDTSRQSVIEKLQEENRLLKQKVIHVEDLNAKWQRYDASRDEYVRGLQAPPGPGLLRKEISRLNTQLAETGKACSHLQQERAAALERVQMLEQQILAYKEDFESERADRERAHCRIQELEEKVSSLLYQVSQTEDSREPGPRRIPPPSNTAKFVETEALGSAAPAGRGPGPGSQRLEPPAEGRDPSTGGRGQGRLQCPRCLRFFGEEQGEELLRHTSLCCQ